MKILRTAVISIPLALFFSTSSNAQNENRTWHFGDHAGIYFPANGELPVPVENSAITTHTTDKFGVSFGSAAAAISDRQTGRVLFYTDGVTVWDSTHQIMQNGEKLLNCPPPTHHILTEKTSAGQGVLIVPEPCDANRYYVFSIDWCDTYDYAPESQQGLYYSVVDMRLNGGRGSVVEKRVRLLNPTTGGLTATVQANGRDYWVVTQGLTAFDLYAFPLTCAGIGRPVITPAPDYLQPVWSGEVPRDWFDGYGTIHISQDGNKLALTYWVDEFWNPLPRPDGDYVDLYRFDPVTGIASNPVSVQGLGVTGWRSHDVAFSPDGNKLYWIEGGDYLYQADLTRRDVGSIVASKTRLGGYIGGAADALQLGPDGRIYFGSHTDTMLSVVHQPNLAGPACQVEMRVVSLNGHQMRSSLPNTIESVLFGKDRTCVVEADFTAAASVDTICAGQPLVLVDRSRGATGGVVWLTPGGREGKIESSGSAQMRYDVPGEYPVTQIAVASRCGAPAYDTAYGSVVVLPSPSVALGRDLWICGATDTTVQLNTEAIGSSLRYEWVPSAGLSCADCPSPTASPERTTSYVITVEQPNGCTASDTITVWVGDYHAELGLVPAPVEPGDTLYIPLVIKSAAEGGETGHLIVRVTSDSAQFLLREELIRTARTLEGTVLEEWSVIRSSVRPGYLELELENTFGKIIELRDGDTLLRVPGVVLLGAPSTSAVSATLQAPDLQCVRFDSASTGLDLVVCGGEYRGIRIGDFMFKGPQAVNSGSGKPAIEFSIPWESPVELALYNIQGARVVTLVEGVLSAGEHRVSMTEVSAGTYFVCLTYGGQVFCSRITLLR